MAKKEITKDVTLGVAQSDLEKLADIILAKQSGGVQGGKPHVPMSAAEVAKLPKKTMEEVAADYYASIDLANFTFPGIHVTSDNQIFIGHPTGENARDNHVSDNKGMTFMSFPKPE